MGLCLTGIPGLCAWWGSVTVLRGTQSISKHTLSACCEPGLHWALGTCSVRTDRIPVLGVLLSWTPTPPTHPPSTCPCWCWTSSRTCLESLGSFWPVPTVAPSGEQPSLLTRLSPCGIECSGHVHHLQFLLGPQWAAQGGASRRGGPSRRHALRTRTPAVGFSPYHLAGPHLSPLSLLSFLLLAPKQMLLGTY